MSIAVSRADLALLIDGFACGAFVHTAHRPQGRHQQALCNLIRALHTSEEGGDARESAAVVQLAAVASGGPGSAPPPADPWDGPWDGATKEYL